MIEDFTKKIVKIDQGLMKKAQKRLDSLTKPQGSLGRLEELAKQIVAITAKESPELRNKVIFTLASDHGVAEENVSAFPKEVTAQMVINFLSGGAGINVLAKHIGARVVVADVGVATDLKVHPKLIIKKINYGTKNMAIGPVMTKAEAIKSVEAGIEIFEEEFKNGIDIIGIGEMGIANTTAASAITALFTGKSVEEVVGRGTGIDDNTLKNKIRVINTALKINDPDSSNAIDVLSKVGGFEIGGLAGIILAASSHRVPVVIDGFISAASALIAYGIEPKVKEYMIAAHSSVEKGHKAILDYLGLKALLDLEMRLGEGTGACLGINLAEAAIRILTQMNTFEGAKVSQKFKS
ncbi:MAG: nicotinate-nucleotide--dimethylbenzimidazole phosphoribosyltransferase [Candidatus Omnitrophota bacterium]|nr:nicotinate-nucleotide--dimethylbenzimidazole phosphoribosyltransferase [Candidatus Omnitrophota bacterium]